MPAPVSPLNTFRPGASSSDSGRTPTTRASQPPAERRVEVERVLVVDRRQQALLNYLVIASEHGLERRDADERDGHELATVKKLIVGIRDRYEIDAPLGIRSKRFANREQVTEDEARREADESREHFRGKGGSESDRDRVHSGFRTLRIERAVPDRRPQPAL